MFDVVLHFLSIAILDNAFEGDTIKRPEDFYNLDVRPPRHSTELNWKKEKLDTPIFRQAVRTEDGIRTSDTEPLRYHTYLYYLQRLGRAAGFMQILRPYCLRRGVGEAVDGECTIFSHCKEL